jgi:hypothetical protein
MAHIDGGLTFFSDHSTAGNGTFTNDGAHVTGFNFNGASNLWFSGSSTAANATITNNGGTVVFAMGGVVSFFANATADSATITNNGATALADGGVTNFFGNSTADNATIINNAGTVSGASGGQTFFASEFGGPPTAGNATITNNGGTVAGAGGGQTTFKDTSTAGNSTLIANGGSNGGEGGAIFFEDRSSGGTARVEVYGRNYPIRNIVLHSSDGRESGDVETLTGDDVSSHWYVTRTGKVYHFVADGDTAYHAGKVFKPEYFSNGAAIGMEQEHIDKKEGWPDVQIDKVAQLVAYLLQSNNLKNVDDIKTHAKIAKPEGRKIDPYKYPFEDFFAKVDEYLEDTWSVSQSA